MSSVIEVNDLVKTYRKAETNAVDHISFAVEEGEFFSLLGPNGAGKTTTISILTTTLSKSSGDVTVAGYDIDKQASNVRRNVGIIFQNPSLDPNLTAEENVRMHAILYGIETFAPTFGMMSAEYQRRVKELADVLDLQKEIFKPIRTFSGGMKQKLEIIRSLMHRPRVLFLDEPTVGLDPLSRSSLWEYLRGVREKEKTTIFLTTHYLDEAEDAEKVCIINKGKIVSFGTPEKIKNELVGTEYLLLDADDKEALQRELDAIGVKYVRESHFKVSMNGHTFQNVIQKIQTPLTLLRTHAPTLEEAYLAIVEEKQ